MQIMNSGATMAALGELKKNDTTLGKELRKVASGMKIGGAGDGASEYAISEKMRVRLRSLEQDIENAQTGKALVKTAMGGIENIQDNLREMKAMAINAANDHNTDADRATLQKEFSQRMEQIDDIAATTNYNGKILLDGRYGTLHTIATSSTSSSSSATPMPDKSPSVILAEQEKCFYDMTRKDDLAVTGSSPYTMPTHAATYTTDSTGNITITSSGVFTLPTSKGTAITITVDASDVVIKGTGDKESEEEIVVTRPNAHLWIDDVRLNNGNHPCIKFTGSGNALMLLGRNLLSDASTKETKAGSFSFPALLDVGEGLTIYNGSSTQEGILYATASSDLMAIAAIGGDNASAHLTIESGTVIAQGYYGAAIGSSQKGNFGDIAINGGRVYALTKAGAAAIGAGSTVGSSTTSAGNISIGKNAIVETFTHGGAGIGTGANSYGVESSAKSITIDSTNVRFFSCYGEAIGSAMGYPSSPHMIVDKWHFLVPDNPVFTGNVGSVSVASGSYLNSFYDATDSKTRYHYFVGSTFSEDGYNHFGTDPTSDPSSSEHPRPVLAGHARAGESERFELAQAARIK